PRRRSRGAWQGRRVRQPARVGCRAAAHTDHPSRQADGIEARRRNPRELEGMAAQIPQGDAGGVPPRAARIEGEGRRRAEDRDRGLSIGGNHTVIASAAKQSSFATTSKLDCFVASLLAMTESNEYERTMQGLQG